jgi:RHS repeat-associated protein
MQPRGLGGFAIPGNRLEAFQDLRYEYDVHGNVTSRKKGAHEVAEFTWNAEHQLKEAKVTRKGTEQTTRYEYDALGRRTRKIDTFGATEYLWDGDLMIESRRNNKQALFLFEPRSFVPLATVQDNKTYWYQCDQVGAPQELTDREGNIVWAADYRVWGEVSLRKTGTDGSSRYARRRQAEPPPVLEQPFRFQGQQFDEETGLHYNRYRYYDPGVGRFVSQDPIGLRGGSNFFLYAPNPMGWVDPFGWMGYRVATRTDSGVELGRVLKDKEAINRAQRGQDVHADSRSEAISLGKKCACGKLMKHKPHPDRTTGSTEGRLPHVHPNNHEGVVGNSHIFYPK